MTRILVNAQGQELVDALGRAYTEGCSAPCCAGGCVPLLALYCGTTPPCLSEVPRVYFCQSVTAIATGAPIKVGDIVLYKGACWRIFGPAAPGVTTEDVTQVSVVGFGNCTTNFPCNGQLYVEAVKCDPSRPGPVIVYVELCAAQALRASMVIPGVKRSICPVFLWDFECYRLGGYVGAVGTPANVYTGTNVAFFSCCDCMASRLQCNSTQTALIGPPQRCHTGKKQGECCGRDYVVESGNEYHVELFSTGGKYHDARQTAFGSWRTGPPQPLPGGGLEMPTVCLGGSISLTVVQGTFTLNRVEDSCAFGWGFPIYCGGRKDVGFGTSFLLSPIFAVLPEGLLRFISVNGVTPPGGPCTFSGVDSATQGQVITMSYALQGTDLGGTFEYEYSVVTGGVLVERGEYKSWFRVIRGAACPECGEQGVDGGEGGEGIPDLTDMLDAVEAM